MNTKVSFLAVFISTGRTIKIVLGNEFRFFVMVR